MDEAKDLHSLNIELLVEMMDPEKTGAVSLDRLLALASRLKKDRSFKKNSMFKSGLELLVASIMLLTIVLVGIYSFIALESDEHGKQVERNLLLKEDIEQALPLGGIITDILNLTSHYDVELDNTVRGMYEEHLNETLWDQLEDNGFVSTFALRNPWFFENTAWFVFTVITTIGYGHIVPKTEVGHWLVIFYSIPAIISMGYFIKKLMNFWKSFPCRKGSVRTQILTLPVFYFIQLAFSGWVFSNSEHWTLSEGVYYTWVTISTIGFGDYTLSDESGIPQTTLDLLILVNGLFLFTYVLTVVGNVIEYVTKPERWHEKFSKAILNKVERMSIPTIQLTRRSQKSRAHSKYTTTSEMEQAGQGNQNALLV